MRFQLAVVLASILTLVAATPAAADSDEHDSKFGAWAAPTNLGATINSAFNDFGPGLSPDGKSLYFASGRPGGFGLADLWVAQRANENAAWGTPVNLGSTVNTAAIEAVPSFSRDGRWMFFNSDRAGGLGSNDIWVSFRVNPNDDFGWQTPMNVGAPVNSASFDAGPALIEHGDEDILYFNSDRLGSQDFYLSVRQKDGAFGTPMLVTALNSVVAEQRLTVRKDHREVFFFSNRVGSAALDLWTSTREDRDATWNPPTNVGSMVNSAANDFQPTLSRDGRTLIFVSDRPGGSGGFDLYMTTRPKGGG
jgi:Tol biopolymer transport system component